jgi:hypothetical protein
MGMTTFCDHVVSGVFGLGLLVLLGTEGHSMASSGWELV